MPRRSRFARHRDRIRAQERTQDLVSRWHWLVYCREIGETLAPWQHALLADMDARGATARMFGTR